MNHTILPTALRLPRRLYFTTFPLHVFMWHFSPCVNTAFTSLNRIIHVISFFFFSQIMLPYWIYVSCDHAVSNDCCCFTWVSRRFSERSDLAVILYMYSIVE